MYVDNPLPHVGTYEVPVMYGSVWVFRGACIVEFIKIVDKPKTVAVVEENISPINPAIQCVEKLHVSSIYPYAYGDLRSPHMRTGGHDADHITLYMRKAWKGRPCVAKGQFLQAVWTIRRVGGCTLNGLLG